MDSQLPRPSELNSEAIVSVVAKTSVLSALETKTPAMKVGSEQEISINDRTKHK